jgi:hypothetical protein
MAKKAKPVESVATLALVAFLDRELEPMMKQLNIPSRSALLRERRKLKSLQSGGYGNAIDKKFPRQNARTNAIELLGDLADCVRWKDIDYIDGAEGIDNYFVALRPLLRQALRRPLTKIETAEMRELQEKAAREEERLRAEWNQGEICREAYAARRAEAAKSRKKRRRAAA